MAGATRVRLAALALLGCGAFALPNSRIAFTQHGVAEGEDALVHAAPTLSSRLASLTPQLLSSAIARVMSLDSRAEVNTGLPAGDIFNRPDGNVLVFVDGLRPTGEDRAQPTRGVGARWGWGTGAGGGVISVELRNVLVLKSPVRDISLREKSVV